MLDHMQMFCDGKPLLKFPTVFSNVFNQGLHYSVTYVFLLIKSQYLWCIGKPPSCSAMFLKGDSFCNILIAYIEDEVFSKKGSTRKGKNLMR